MFLLPFYRSGLRCHARRKKENYNHTIVNPGEKTKWKKKRRQREKKKQKFFELCLGIIDHRKWMTKKSPKMSKSESETRMFVFGVRQQTK